MEVGDKLKELNLTEDEMGRLAKAFKDEEFRKMLRNYAHELSDPENKKRYEEEIKLWEQERGNTIEFIHPEPFRALRTNVNGTQKCYINICANEKIGKPESKWGMSEDGRRGLCWSLPHSLHPGRGDTDGKGNEIMIYDVIFHPDTLHLASKNTRFMDMVDSTAMQGIQSAFKVTLDKNNVKEMSTKYKGTPQPCVIRKHIPGYKPKEPSEGPLTFPYPDEKHLQTKPTATKPSSDAEPKSFSVQPQSAKELIKPNYTVKYQHFVDLQDFRCSRDSAQSPRPKQIVVTIDVPLLKAARDASLEVKERQLLLESKKPAYRLELPLAYPVDEEKGEARFNKQRGQLTVTLHVLPPDEAFDFAVGLPQIDERQEEKSEQEEEDKWKEEREGKKSEGERGQEKGVDQRREGVVRENETWGKQESEADSEEEDVGVEEAKWKKQERKGQEGVEKEKQCFQCDAVNVSAEEENSPVDDRLVEIENQPAEHSSCTGKEEVNQNLESTPKMTKDHQEETGESSHGDEKVETDAAFLHHRSSEESQTPGAAGAHSQKDMESSETPATDEANRSGRRGSDNGVTLLSEEPAREERENADDLPTEKIVHKPPPALLREIDRDGNENIISDHSTSAGFIFQNSLMFELD